MLSCTAACRLSSVPVPQVLLEALYFSLVAKRLHPEEDDTLVEQPCVEHVSERISKVRPPQGFALFQAKEEARKVKLLHRMLKVGHLLLPGAQGSGTSECDSSQSSWDALSASLQLLPQFLHLCLILLHCCGKHCSAAGLGCSPSMQSHFYSLLPRISSST